MTLTQKQKELLKLLTEKENVLAFGGSRSGKTFLFLYALVCRAMKTPSRHGIVRQIFRDTRQKIGMVSLPKVLEVTKIPYEIDKGNWVFHLGKGSEIWLFGLDDAGERDQRILGSEYSTLLFEEASEIPHSSVTTALTRLAERNSLRKTAWFSCNPPTKNHWLYKVFMQGLDPDSRLPIKNFSDYGNLRLNPDDNQENIDENYIKRLDSLPERQRIRFRMGEWGEIGEGALWRQEWIDNARVTALTDVLVETVIAVDPACGGECETGIVAVGRGETGDFYILDDRTSRGTPAEWVQEVLSLSRKHGTKKIVAESNQGGNMIIQIFADADPSLEVELIHAGQSKKLRAEPVAALAQRGKIHHLGRLVELEDQLTSWKPGDDSPDRMDAMVHGVSAMMKNSSGRGPTIASSGSEYGIDDDALWKNL
jgi:hypothetical protein